MVRAKKGWPKNWMNPTQKFSPDKAPVPTSISEVVAKRIRKIGRVIMKMIIKKSFFVPLALLSSKSIKSGVPTTIFFAM